MNRRYYAAAALSVLALGSAALYVSRPYNPRGSAMPSKDSVPIVSALNLQSTAPIHTPFRSTSPVQAELDRLITDPRLGNFSDVVSEVRFDPGFVSYEADLQALVEQGKRDNLPELVAAATYSLTDLQAMRKTIAYATTLSEGKTFNQGKKSVVYVGSDAAQLASEDKLSILEHEGWHAHTFRYGITLNGVESQRLAQYFPDKKLPDELVDGLLTNYDEAYAYGLQINSVITRKFRVSPGIWSFMQARFVQERAKLKIAARENTLIGKVAGAMYRSLPVKGNE